MGIILFQKRKFILAIVSTGLFVFFIARTELLLAEGDVLKSCYVCHSASNDWIKGRSTILKSWSTDNPAGIPSTHMWLEPELVKKVARHQLALQEPQVKLSESFYSKLHKAKEDVKRNEPDQIVREEWKALIREGEKLAPGFKIMYWEPASAVLEMKSNIRGHLLRIFKALMMPYATVLLIPGQEIVYDQILDTGVKGIAFMRGTSRTFDNELVYNVLGSEKLLTKVQLSLKDKAKGNAVTADFLMNPTGVVSNFVSNPPDHVRARNSEKMWMKSKTDHLTNFTMEHILEFPKMSGQTMEPVTLVYDIKIQGIVNLVKIGEAEFTSAIPLLHGTATFKQKHGEHIGVRGQAEFYTMPIGLTAHSDIKMHFKLKVKGININASTRNRMAINLNKSVLYPALRK